jgi:hypothetical protein
MLHALRYSTVTVTASVTLANDMVPAISSSGAANIKRFKNREVPLPHSVYVIFEYLYWFVT